MTMTLRLKICRDVWGTWSVHGLSPIPVAHLPSLSASLDYARRECSAAPATIELLIDGFYAVVRQEEGWPRQLVTPGAAPPCPLALNADPPKRLLSSRFHDWAAGRWKH